MANLVLAIALLLFSNVGVMPKTQQPAQLRPGIYLGGGNSYLLRLSIAPRNVRYDVWYVLTGGKQVNAVRYHAVPLRADASQVQYALNVRGKACGTMMLRQAQADIIVASLSGGDNLPLSRSNESYTRQWIRDFQRIAQENARVHAHADEALAFPGIPTCRSAVGRIR